MNDFIHLLSTRFSNYQQLNENIFLEEEDLKLTFREAYQIIKALGKILKEYVEHGDRVAIFLPRSAKSAIAIYSILYINAIYVPFNITDPTERITFLINNTDPKIIIGKGQKPIWAKDIIWFNIDEFNWLNYINLEFQLDIQNAKSNLATILHTSGSTGTPKGVALSHKAMITFSDWAGTIFKINSSDIIANLAPFYFDLSVFDLYTSFRFGSKLIFIPQYLTLNPVEMTNWILQNGVTVWYTVPSMLAFLLNKGNISTLVKSNLRLILFAGEPISKQILLDLLEALPNVEFYNLYGPVETNVCCFWKVNHSLLKELDCIPIGLSACNDELKIDNDTNTEHLLLDCDLLIIDDLGTEQITNFSKTELFNLLNKKLLRGKKMLVSSNFTLEVLSKTYSERITSRLFGNFSLNKFFGEDIRVKRNFNRMK